jgi:sugar lactone lactonase YvrE
LTRKIQLEGLGFPEGPVALGDGSIAFVDLLHQTVRRFANGKMEVIAELQGSPNGMRLGPDGLLYVANNGGVAPRTLHEIKVMEPQISGRIQRIAGDGRVEDIITDLPGAGPWRPNDLIFTPNGRIVFSDPQNWEEVADWSVSGKIPGYGGGRSLRVAVTLRRRILKFPWFGERVGAPQVWCQFDDGTAPDGILLSGDRLYVAGSVGDKVTVVDLSGRPLHCIDTGVGSDPTNLCIQDNKLWVTLGPPGN